MEIGIKIVDSWIFVKIWFVGVKLFCDNIDSLEYMWLDKLSYYWGIDEWVFYESVYVVNFLYYCLVVCGNIL